MPRAEWGNSTAIRKWSGGGLWPTAGRGYGRLKPATTDINASANRSNPAPVSRAAWAVVSGYLAILAFLLLPNNQRLPAVIISAGVFALMPLLFPRCRPVIATPLCPLNWALLVFFLQLILLPLVVIFVGPSAGTLPALPSNLATNISLLLSTLGYIAFCAAYHCVAAHWARTAPTDARAARPWTPSAAIIALFAGIGIVGLLLNFGGLREIAAYFTSAAPPESLEAPVAASLRTAAPLFLKPFLGIALVMGWCAWVDRRARTSARLTRILVTAGFALAIAAVYATFGFNRGAFTAPLLAMAAVYLARVRRTPIKAMVAVAALLVAAFSLLGGASPADTGGAYGTPTQPASGFIHATQSTINDQAQVYGAAPQFVGYLLERTDYARRPYGGSTLLSSILYPVPILGKPFRAGSGVVIYNALVERPDGTLDQNLPIQGELFINFHVVGIIAGFALLGCIVARLQRGFAAARTALDAYIWMYFAVWILFTILGSLSAVSQIFIYFCWPIYGYFALSFLLARRPRMGRKGQ